MIKFTIDNYIIKFNQIESKLSYKDNNNSPCINLIEILSNNNIIILSIKLSYNTTCELYDNLLEMYTFNKDFVFNLPSYSIIDECVISGYIDNNDLIILDFSLSNKDNTILKIDKDIFENEFLFKFFFEFLISYT